MNNYEFLIIFIQKTKVIGQNRWTHPGMLDRYAYVNSRVTKVLRQKYKGNGADFAEVVQKVLKFCLSETFWNSCP